MAVLILMAKVATMMAEMRRKMGTRMRRMRTRKMETGTRMRTSLLFMTLKYQVFLIGTHLAKTSSVKLQL